MNIVEKGLLIVILLVISIFMLPTILGIVLSTVGGEVGFIILFCVIIGIIGIPILIIKHKEE